MYVSFFQHHRCLLPFTFRPQQAFWHNLHQRIVSFRVPALSRWADWNWQPCWHLLDSGLSPWQWVFLFFLLASQEPLAEMCSSTSALTLSRTGEKSRRGARYPDEYRRRQDKWKERAGGGNADGGSTSEVRQQTWRVWDEMERRKRRGGRRWRQTRWWGGSFIFETMKNS